MTLYEYKALDEIEQREVLWEHSVYIGERFEEQYHIKLFQLFSFYVEQYFHVRDGLIKKERSFTSTNQLDDYLNTFHLGNLDV